MTNSAFVSFLRRSETGYAQQIFEDAAAMQAHCAKLLTAICADPAAKLDKRVPTTGGKPISLDELRIESLLLQADFEKLRGNKSFPDSKARTFLGCLIGHSIDMSCVAEDNLSLKDMEDLRSSADELCEMGKALKAMETAYQAGVAEGISQGRTAKKRTL